MPKLAQLLRCGQKWNSKIAPWPKMEFKIWTLAKNGIPKLDPGQK